MKVIAAASFHHRWGSPDFPEVSWRAADDAKKMKLDLMQGTVFLKRTAMRKWQTF